MIERGYLSEKRLIYTDNTNPDNDILVKHSLSVLLGYMRSCWYVVRQQEQALACRVYQWDIVEWGIQKRNTSVWFLEMVGKNTWGCHCDIFSGEHLPTCG